MPLHHNVDPKFPYDGPDFDEFCIAENGYLKASRDRSPCISCALSKLCQAGFEKQVHLAVEGKDPSLTKDCELTASDLTAERLLAGLTEEEIAFVKTYISSLAEECGNG